MRIETKRKNFDYIGIGFHIFLCPKIHIEFLNACSSHAINFKKRTKK